MTTAKTAAAPVMTPPPSQGLMLSSKSLDPFADTFSANLYSQNGMANMSLNGRVSDTAKSAGDPKAVFKAAAEEMLTEALNTVKAL